MFERAGATGYSDAADIDVFNAPHNQSFELRALPADEFERAWRVGCFGGFLVGREAARLLAPLERGTVIFTGATASLRGRPPFASFAAAKVRDAGKKTPRRSRPPRSPSPRPGC